MSYQNLRYYIDKVTDRHYQELREKEAAYKNLGEEKKVLQKQEWDKLDVMFVQLLEDDSIQQKYKKLVEAYIVNNLEGPHVNGLQAAQSNSKMKILEEHAPDDLEKFWESMEDIEDLDSRAFSEWLDLKKAIEQAEPFRGLYNPNNNGDDKDLPF
jgi:hypothetical protein